jgi:sugar/nucleoside kinase (ribokinase family)
VGRDTFGQVVHSLVELYDPDLMAGMVVDEQVSTSYTIIINPPGVDRIFLHSPGANHAFDADDINYDLVRKAALFHFGYPPVMRRMYENNGQGLVEVFRQAKQTGVTTALDMCYPDPTSEGGWSNWIAILEDTLPFTDIFLPSFEELLLMLRRTTYEQFTQHGSVLEQATPLLLHDLSSELLSMGVRIAVIKLGERGLYCRSAGQDALQSMGRASPKDASAWADREMWAPCFHVQIVGTTGAGDAAIAGFLAALLRDFNPEQATTVAVAVGACNVEAADALSGLRSWEATLQRIEAGWERLPLHLDEPDWEWDLAHALWRRTRISPN